jgi:STE24 endopeptidase
VRETDDPTRAVRYTRVREALFVVDLIWGALSQLLLFVTGRSAALRALASRSAPRPWLADPLYLLLYGLLNRLLDLPLSYLAGHVVEHRFGLSTQGLRGWARDLLKATALGLAFELPLALLSYWTIRRSPRWWWLILSGLALPFTVVLAQLYPILIAPIFNKFVPLADPALADRVKALAGRAGVQVADVTQMDMSRQTRKANAFFAGLGRTKRIALGDTLVRELTSDEVEVVVAHELAHQVRGDVWKGIALSALATLGAAFLLSRTAQPLLDRLARRSSVRRVDDVASSPLLRLLLTALSLAAMPLANAFSRNMVERPADRFALELTDRPDAFASAMEKLGRMNLSDPSPPRIVELLLYSHPPVASRIAMARAYRR